MKKIAFLFAILIATFCCFCCSAKVIFAANSASSQEIGELEKQIQERKNKISEIEKSIEKYKKDIEKKRAESVSLSNQISILDNRMAEVELDIEATNEKLKNIEMEIEILGLEINGKKQTIEKQKNIIGELVRNIYTHGNKNFIEILASYENFSTFYNDLQNMQTLESDLGKNAKALRIAKEDLEEKSEKTIERKLAYEDLQQALSQRQDELNEQNYAKQDLLAQAQSSELKFKTLVENLKRQYSETEQEIEGFESEVRKKLESQNKIEVIQDSPSNMLWPAQSCVVTANFHDPDYPYRHIFEHSGIDIKASQGTPIKAAASGYVGRAKKCSSWQCYSYIMIVHSDGISTVYGHLSKITVSEGNFVARGDIIGYSGGTPKTIGAGPFVTGPHLHFEVRGDGIPINPLNYLSCK